MSLSQWCFKWWRMSYNCLVSDVLIIFTMGFIIWGDTLHNSGVEISSLVDLWPYEGRRKISSYVRLLEYLGAWHWKTLGEIINANFNHPRLLLSFIIFKEHRLLAPPTFNNSSDCDRPGAVIYGQNPQQFSQNPGEICCRILHCPAI